MLNPFDILIDRHQLWPNHSTQSSKFNRLQVCLPSRMSVHTFDKNWQSQTSRFHSYFYRTWSVGLSINRSAECQRSIQIIRWFGQCIRIARLSVCHPSQMQLTRHLLCFVGVIITDRFPMKRSILMHFHWIHMTDKKIWLLIDEYIDGKYRWVFFTDRRICVNL
jgi:hypothetical protein